ncbi:MAG: tetraacyldisaccharide 4'-kinase, partial [Pseudomonadota bacterium]
MKLEQFLRRAWTRVNGLSIALLPLAVLYGVAARLHRLLYEIGFKKVRKPDLPVIVVGNLTVGGSGKTPVVAALAKALVDRGLRPGIVSRGYRRNEMQEVTLVDIDSPVAEVGDEPLLLRHQTGQPVAVGANRYLAAQTLADNYPLDCIISDDGLQHFALQSSFTICIDDQSLGESNHLLLPAGPY